MPKNVAGTAKRAIPNAPSQYHAMTGKDPRAIGCAKTHCRNNFGGMAHVNGITSNSRKEYLVPLCAGHNNPSNTANMQFARSVPTVPVTKFTGKRR